VFVIDSSAAIDALLEPRDPLLVERLSGARELHAPHLLDVEMLHALRRLVVAGTLTPERAEYARKDFAALRIRRYAHHPLADRIWALRDNLTAYDAAFVALAEALTVPLVTCDARLATAAVHQADVEVFGTSPTATG
jgi:predicted nucleic acid-binding protein